MPDSSLRERSKVRRRAAIQRSALRLFAERGYDGATLADIADDAEVAPRTVSMYFPTKLDMALSTSSDIAARLTTTIQAHPRLPFTEIVDRWLVGETESADPGLTALTVAMFDANPELREASSAQIVQATQIAGPALIAQLGLPPGDPMIPVAAAAVGAAITAYLTTVLRPGSPPDLRRSFIRYLCALITAARTG